MALLRALLVRAMRASARVPWLRPLPLVAIVAFVIARQRGDIDTLAPTRSAALASALASRGLLCTPHDVVWVHGPGGTASALASFEGRAIVRAHVGADPNDVYAIDVRLSPEGVPLELGTIYNLTRTASVDEESVHVRGDVLAYVAAAGDLRTAIHLVDLGGRDVDGYTDFTRLQKWQTALTNLQQTGETRGVLHTVFSLDPVAAHVDLDLRDDGMVVAIADGRRIVLDPERQRAIEGAGWVRSAPDQRARPGNLVTWAVDRVRAMDFVGEERMQVIKAVAFTALDRINRVRTSIFGEQDTAGDVARDFGTLYSTDLARPEFTDPEIGWPPEPLTPLITPPLPGEGKWIALGKDPFITPSYGLPSALVMSFIRPDRERKDARVYVTMWDPRQIALHMQAGTVEPLSATGEAGPGQIPRAPEIMRRVVAGFNGGFQAMHGEYGMQADGVLYLPPKPYAATVMELRDGTTAFGSWPGPPSDPKQELEVPSDVLSYRQNLTALLEHGKYNPWGRGWWGGTPPGWQDNIHTTRSGICLTKEGFVAYFYGSDVAADVLARAMIQARCDYAVHLDMNPGLVGFELYDVEPSSTFKPLTRPLQTDWEYEGSFKALPDFHYRARKMIRGMVEQNFPQYIHLDGRDFFYLTRRPLLPGRDLAALMTPAEPGEGTWRTKGLPEHGFPYALATTQLRVPERPDVRLRVVRMDPHTIAAAGSVGTDEHTPTIALFTNNTAHPSNALYFLGGASAFSIAQSPPPDAIALAETLPFAGGSPPDAAAGIEDEEGMLVWIELPPNVAPDESTRAAMKRVLDALGCGTRVAVRARVLLGGSLDSAGDPAPPPTGTVTRLVRVAHPASRLYFDTPIVGPGTWQPLQMQRIRYFNRPKPSSDAGADGAAPPLGDAGTR
jgi:hypothetical protein